MAATDDDDGIARGGECRARIRAGLYECAPWLLFDCWSLQFTNEAIIKRLVSQDRPAGSCIHSKGKSTASSQQPVEPSFGRHAILSLRVIDWVLVCPALGGMC